MKIGNWILKIEKIKTYRERIADNINEINDAANLNSAEIRAIDRKLDYIEDNFFLKVEQIEESIKTITLVLDTLTKAK